MKYNIGDTYEFQDGTKGTVITANKNIIGGLELDVRVNEEIRSIVINENGTVQ